jgi:hypothetical protein
MWTHIPAPSPRRKYTRFCTLNTQRLGSRCLLPWRPTNRWRSLFKFFSVRQILPHTLNYQLHMVKDTRCSINIGYIPLQALICRGDAMSSRVGGTASALLHNSSCYHTNWRRIGIATALQVPASDNLVPHRSHIDELRFTKLLTNRCVVPDVSSSTRPCLHCV